MNTKWMLPRKEHVCGEGIKQIIVMKQMSAFTYSRTQHICCMPSVSKDKTGVLAWKFMRLKSSNKGRWRGIRLRGSNSWWCWNIHNPLITPRVRRKHACWGLQQKLQKVQVMFYVKNNILRLWGFHPTLRSKTSTLFLHAGTSEVWL